jgi:putative effector of murein hydrolase LrgA (UPF0299 family)
LLQQSSASSPNACCSCCRCCSPFSALPAQTAAALAAFAAEVKDVIVAATAGSSGLSADEIKKQLPAAPAAASGSSAAPGGIVGAVLPWLQLWSTLASLYYTDKLIKNLFVEFGIKFPSALAGMFGVFALLCLVGDSTASKVMGMYAPALNWIARWLPLFYVPALVTLPMALNGIPGEWRLAGNMSHLACCVCVFMNDLQAKLMRCIDVVSK